MAIFRKSTFAWQCDKCGVYFAAGKGGVCTACKRALCDSHLHGSFVAKMRHRLSGERAVCTECSSRVGTKG